MPTYQYACTVCAEQVEVVQRFTDEPLTECPACGGALRKVFSPVGVVFKGSGFYKTDSRRSSGSAEKKKAETSSSGSSSGSSAESSPGSSGDSSSGASSAGSSPSPAAAPAASSTGTGTAAAS